MPDLRYAALFLVLASVNALAESVFAIDPQMHGMHKTFGPPKPITPQTVLNVRPENQFDHSDRDHYSSVLNSIDSRMDKPFHLTTGRFGHSRYSGALWRQREADYYVIASLSDVDADAYKDGDQQRVDYGYYRKGAALVLGVLPNMFSEHRFTVVYDDIADDKQPQHLMDPVDTERLIGKYNLRIGSPADDKTMHIELSALKLDRHANNFNLRPVRKKMPKIFMDVMRKKYTADIHVNYAFNDQHKSTIGLRMQDDVHDAKRYVVTPKGNQQNGYRFPDVHTRSIRLSGSHLWQISKQHHVKAALSYDWQNAEAEGANQSMAIAKLPTATQLWYKYYGQKLMGKIKHDGLSVKLRYAFLLSPRQKFYTDFESLYRMPENPERFAVLPGPAGKGWASNPWIKPERENRITLGMAVSGEGWGGYQKTRQDDYAAAWHITTELFYADVDDFVALDRYRGPKKPLKGNIISRNIDAHLAGVSIAVNNNWTQNLSTVLRAQYRYGENKTNHRPLYQIKPFELNASIDWKSYFDSGSYNVGANVRYQHKQSRRDDNPLTGLGIDNITDGFAATDLYAGIDWKNNMGFALGIDNVFDKRYAEYISGNHVESLNPYIVNAPGRTFWLRFNAAF